MAAKPSPNAASELGLDRRSLGKIVIGLVILLIVTGVAGLLLREPLTRSAEWFVSELGLAGLFFGVMIVDAWVVPPLTHEPLLFFCHAGGVPFWQTFVVASAGSVCAGPLGYAMGRWLGTSARFERRFAGSSVQGLMQRRGAIVVAAAAITPIPFAITTWLAGASRLRFAPFLLACLVRILKVGVYLSLIAAGWGIG